MSTDSLARAAVADPAGHPAGDTVADVAPDALFTTAVSDALGADFRPRQLGREVVTGDVGVSNAGRLLGWSDVNHLLATRPATTAPLRLYREGARVPTGASADAAGECDPHGVRPEDVYAELRAGATLVLDNVEKLHARVAAAAEDLVRFVREPVRARMSLTWSTTQNQPAHAGEQDLMVVQIMGASHWRISAPSPPAPRGGELVEAAECPDPGTWDGMLHAGQVLHVPRGWPATVRGRGGASVHLAFAFRRRTGLDWAEWLVQQLRDDELFGQGLPRFAAAHERRAHTAALRARLDEVLSRASVDRYFARCDDAMPRRQAFCLPAAVDFAMPADDDTVTFTPVSQPHLDEDDAQVRLTVANTTYTFAGIVTPLLQALAARRQLSVGQLRHLSRLHDDMFAAALELLVEQHLVTIARLESAS